MVGETWVLESYTYFSAVRGTLKSQLGGEERGQGQLASL